MFGVLIGVKKIMIYDVIEIIGLVLSLKIAMDLIGFTGNTPFLNKIFFPSSKRKINRRTPK